MGAKVEKAEIGGVALGVGVLRVDLQVVDHPEEEEVVVAT